METTMPAAVKAAPKKKQHSLLVDLIIRLVKEKPLATAGGIILVIVLLVSILAPLIAPYPFDQMNLPERLRGPSVSHFLGTDSLGRDVFSRIIYGARTSMMVGFLGPLLCIVVAMILGLTSGFFGGKLDMFLQRFVDAWMCFPWLFLVLSIMTLLGPGLAQVIIVLGVQNGIRNSRVVRSAVITIRQNAYVEAAKSIGSPSWATLRRHIVPNITAPLIIIFTTTMGAMILAESTMSFLGFGVPPPNPTWGGMLSGDARTYMYQAPWLAVFPGVALSIAVYGINMLGDGVRDILDPRLRGKLGRYGSLSKNKLAKKVN